MLLLAKIFLVVSGFFLIVDGIFIMAGIPNFVNPEWPLPCPLVLIGLGIGIILYILAGGIHRHQE